MPIMRNPFRRQDENARPNSGIVEYRVNIPAPNSTATKEKQPAEYKLSEINDSGVFVPPSPTEEKNSFWRTSSSRSTTSSRSRSLFDENEPFNISRESFDSYRRSFDISARSPIIQPDVKPRGSLDSRIFLAPPRHSNSFRRPVEVPGTQPEEEPESLEEVSLDEPKPLPPKKRGMLSRIIDSDTSSERSTNTDGAKSSWHHFGTRKRGHSGQGAELDSIPKRDDTPKPESQLKQQEMETFSGAENTQAPAAQVDSTSTK